MHKSQLKSTSLVIFLTAIMFFLNSCATSMNLQKAPQQSSAMGIISLMGNTANVSSSNQMWGKNKAISLSPLPLDKKITNNLADLLKNRGYHQVQIIRTPQNNPITQLSPYKQIFSLSDVSSKAIDYIKTVTKPNQFDLIVAIIPSNARVPYAPGSGMQFRYGIYSHSMLGMDKKVYFFAGSQILVINGGNYALQAKQRCDALKEVTNLNWQDSQTVSAENIDQLKRWLMSNIAPKIQGCVLETLNVD